MFSSRGGIAIAAAAGGVWGLGAYALLWGHTSVVIHRAFVVSLPGTALLLPARAVLWGIHRAEVASGETFEFTGNTWWIGAASAAVGAAMCVLVWSAASRLVAALGRRGQAGSASRSLPSASDRKR